MVAGDIWLAVDRRMAQPATHGPAVIGMKELGLIRRREPAGDAAHLPGIEVENIEPPGDLRRDVGREKLGHFNHILERLASLQALGHPRQQLADRPVSVALLFQTLARQAVLAENADRLRHIANLINLGEVRRLDGVILRGEPLHDIAQAYNRVQHPALQNKT
nr:Uncharacterised protein [Raoultella sp. NCTC 9187]